MERAKKDIKDTKFIGLNPLFIRSRFGTKKWQSDAHGVGELCLNPLFIRSRFGTEFFFSSVASEGLRKVSIPYSSGLGLEPIWHEVGPRIGAWTGLNPLFIRSRFGTMCNQVLSKLLGTAPSQSLIHQV